MSRRAATGVCFLHRSLPPNILKATLGINCRNPLTWSTRLGKAAGQSGILTGSPEALKLKVTKQLIIQTGAPLEVKGDAINNDEGQLA